jgi:small subunit ribosomal protein S7
MLLSSCRSTIIRSAPIRSPKLLSHINTSPQTPESKNAETIRDVLGAFGALQAEPVQPTPPATRPTTGLSLEGIPPAQDPLLKFIASCMMEGGKRARAEKATSEILIHISALTKAPALPALRQAVEMAAPAVRVMSHRAGGKAVAKPVALNERQRTKRAIESILKESETRPGHTWGERVARECIGILGGKSKVLDAKDKIHQLALVNRSAAVFPPLLSSPLTPPAEEISRGSGPRYLTIHCNVIRRLKRQWRKRRARCLALFALWAQKVGAVPVFRL